jgi:hypothetical protein
MSKFYDTNLDLAQQNAETRPDDDVALNEVLKNSKTQNVFFEQIDYVVEQRLKLERLKRQVSEDKTGVRDAFRFKTTGYIDLLVESMVKDQLAKELNKNSQNCDLLQVAIDRQLEKDAENDD